MTLRSAILQQWYQRSTWIWILWPLQWLYYLILLIKHLFKPAALSSHLPRPRTIIVGNLTVGGNGKTPFVAYLATQFTKRQLKVAIMGHGYRCQLNQACWVNEHSQPQEVGDEALWLFHHTQCPVVVAPTRKQAWQAVLAHRSFDLVIADDGLHDHSFPHDHEWVMMHHQRQLGNGGLLPFGPVRYPKTLLSASAKMISHHEFYDQPLDHGYWTHRQLKHFWHKGKDLPLSHLKGRQVHAVTAIAHPEVFVDNLISLGINVTAHYFADHHLFSQQDFDQLASEIIVMTEKDWVKCQSFQLKNVYVLMTEIKVSLKMEKWVDDKVNNIQSK
jgi:tetraacyldisaccharide 4'-kinase